MSLSHPLSVIPEVLKFSGCAYKSSQYCKMSLLLELHQSKLTEIDEPLTFKLHRCLCHSEVEVKLDLLDLATFLSSL